jgi:hypothetical protein
MLVLEDFAKISPSAVFATFVICLRMGIESPFPSTTV